MRSPDTEIEHQVRPFSSWGNPTAPPYQSNEDRNNTLMRVCISPNHQRTIKQIDKVMNIEIKYTMEN